NRFVIDRPDKDAKVSALLKVDSIGTPAFLAKQDICAIISLDLNSKIRYRCKRDRYLLSALRSNHVVDSAAARRTLNGRVALAFFKLNARLRGNTLNR